MGMSDCEKCWDTPCTCGHRWRARPTWYLLNLRKVLDDILSERTDTETSRDPFAALAVKP